MDYPKDKNISHNQQDPNTLRINSNNQNTPMIEEPFSNSFETKKLEIPFSKQTLNIFFFIFLVISSLIYSLSVISIETVYGPIFFILEFLVFLCFENNKIVIIKDEFQNKINIKVLYYLFIETKKFNFYLGNIYFNMVYFYNKYIFLVVNNCEINPENDFNTPFQIYFYENINLNKFKGQNQLNNILNDFLRDKENPLNSNANSDMNNQENNLTQNNFNEYLVVNEHFYIYHNKYPLKNNYCEKCCLKCLTLIIHSFFIFFGIIIFLEDDDDEDNNSMYNSFFFLCIINYFIFGFLGSCVCSIMNYNFNKSCLRIDIKFSFNFDKIFIGSLNLDKNIYDTTSQFDINKLDRFILQNNNGYELKVKFKGSLSKTICYINDMRIGFQGLLNILNQKIVDNQNNNNGEQQHLKECLPPLAITPD